MKGAEAPGWEVGACPEASALVKQPTPFPSCEVEAMAELMTARLAELVSARLSDGRCVFRMLRTEVPAPLQNTFASLRT